jgi:putative heme-binding domain-containing protein
MRRANLDELPTAAILARDKDPGVRRDVALSLRDVPADKSLDLLVEIAKGYDGKDRSYLEAWGTGASKKEAALYDRIRKDLGVKNDPLTWSPAFARLAWRLHVPAAVPDLTARAHSPKLSIADRQLALDTLAFTTDPSAAKAMLTLAAPNSQLRDGAILWLLNRQSSDWSNYGLLPELKTAGIYDPESIVLKEIVTPLAAADLPQLSVDEITKLTGNADRGKETVARCVMCHTINGTGAEVGPALDGWGRGKSPAVIAGAIVNPNSEIAFGYEGTELRTKDGLRIQGVLIKQGDPSMIRSMGGVTQIVPADRIGGRQRMKQSLMMSAAQLGLTAQDVADLVAFLSRN